MVLAQEEIDAAEVVPYFLYPGKGQNTVRRGKDTRSKIC